MSSAHGDSAALSVLKLRGGSRTGCSLPTRTQGLSQQNAEGTEPAGRHRPRCPGPCTVPTTPRAEGLGPGPRWSRGTCGGVTDEHGGGKSGHDPRRSGEGEALTAAPCPARWYKSAQRGRPGGLLPPRSARSGRSSTATARRHRVPSCPRTCRDRRGPGGPWGDRGSAAAARRAPTARASGSRGNRPCTMASPERRARRPASRKLIWAGPCWGRARRGCAGWAVAPCGRGVRVILALLLGPWVGGGFFFPFGRSRRTCAVARLVPPRRRGHERQHRGRARGCQELRWRRGGGDKAERGGEGGLGRLVRKL